MPILELLSLRLKEGITPTSPSFLQTLSTVRSTLKTNSQFYNNIEDASIIYILGLWPSLAAHHEFLKSPQRDDILRAQESQVDFNWMVHLELDDGNGNGNGNGNGMESLPLDAPVLAIARLGSEQHSEVYRNFFVTAATTKTLPYKVVDVRRCDVEPGEQEESFIFSGWETVEAYKSFIAAARMRKSNKEDTGLGDHYEEGIEVMHARNLER